MICPDCNGTGWVGGQGPPQDHSVVDMSDGCSTCGATGHVLAEVYSFGSVYYLAKTTTISRCMHCHCFTLDASGDRCECGEKFYGARQVVRAGERVKP